jgi:ABC-2 type transport system permease protein
VTRTDLDGTGTGNGDGNETEDAQPDGGVVSGHTDGETGEAGAGAAEPVDRPTVRTGSFAREVWVNFVRWSVKAVRNPFVLVVTMVQPIFFLVLFTEVFGGIATGVIGGGGAAGGGAGGAAAGNDAYVTFLVPAIVIQVSLVAAATSGIGLVNDIESGMFNKVLASPMNRVAVFLGKTLSEAARIAVQLALVLGLGVLLGADIAAGLAGAVGVILVGLLFSVWFTGYSNVIAIRTGDSESTIISANILQFPLLFVSSAFLPLDVLPEWIQVVAMLNPVTYGVDAARTIMLDGWVLADLIVPIAVLVVIDLVFGAVAVWHLREATDAEA